jgi:hypothetical protein
VRYFALLFCLVLIGSAAIADDSPLPHAPVGPHSGTIVTATRKQTRLFLKREIFQRFSVLLTLLLTDGTELAEKISTCAFALCPVP